jgi:hypothetical protein
VQAALTKYPAAYPVEVFVKAGPINTGGQLHAKGIHGFAKPANALKFWSSSFSPKETP